MTEGDNGKPVRAFCKRTPYRHFDRKGESDCAPAGPSFIINRRGARCSICSNQIDKLGGRHRRAETGMPAEQTANE
jgi:hypothetical protein